MLIQDGSPLRFDSRELRQICKDKEIHPNIESNSRNTKLENQSTEYLYFDEELYKRRNVIEHANAWMDSFKALLIRFETKATNWSAFILLAFAVRFLRKISNKK